ncbi:MAG TPA: c-type cytochrome biogenesis protein CcsB [Streptosporangiaceae bacterium]|nr:c-type cytochrome biogenesis protein CcsB [Streptosporangiaceae bacterium]
MPVIINHGLADASNGFLLATVVLYALAMLSYACDFAFRKERLIAPEPAQASAKVSELVGVGSAGAAAGVAAPAGAAGATGAPVGSAAVAARPEGPSGSGGGSAAGDSTEAGLWPTGFWMRTAFTLTCTGLTAHLAAIVTRGLAEHRVPWGNMYEFIAAISCMAVLVLVTVSIRFRAYYIGLFVLLPVVLALALDVTVVYTPAGSLVPALNSYWIAIHVTAMIVASGLYIVGAVVTAMYLIADRNERRTLAGLPSRTEGLMMHLPGTTVLDRLSYRTILFAFPVWTFGIMAGAIWADHAWGRYWGWDPKETWSFITWVVYAGFLHARATAGWRGRRAAYIQLAGFGCLMFNLIGINLWVTGLHSYAGLSG